MGLKRDFTIYFPFVLVLIRFLTCSCLRAVSVLHIVSVLLNRGDYSLQDGLVMEPGHSSLTPWILNNVAE